METAGGADKLPPIAVRSPTRAVGWKEMIVAITPDGTFTPRVAAIAPVGPARGAPSGFPVKVVEIGLSASDGGLSSIASFEAISARFFWG